MEAIWEKLFCLLLSGLSAGFFGWALRGLRQKRADDLQARKALEDEALRQDRQKGWTREKQDLQGRLETLQTESEARTESQKKELAALRVDHQALRQDLIGKEEDLRRLRALLDESETRLRDLSQSHRLQQAATKDKDAIVARMQRRISELEAQLGQLSEKEAWQQAALSGVEEEKEKLGARIAELERQLSRAVEQRARTESSVAFLEAEWAARLEAAAKGRDQEIERLRVSLAEAEARPQQPAAPVDEGDNLQLIKGVGRAIQKILHGMGIVSFRQIAQWTEADIDRVDAQLGRFRGRIRRDRWVQSAREEHVKKYGVAP